MLRQKLKQTPQYPAVKPHKERERHVVSSQFICNLFIRCKYVHLHRNGKVGYGSNQFQVVQGASKGTFPLQTRKIKLNEMYKVKTNNGAK